MLILFIKGMREPLSLKVTKMKKPKFELIELVVVIAIISVLASLLYSSYSSARELAKRTTCMSNLSQIRNITELHRKDYKHLPYSNIWFSDFSYASSYLDEGKALEVFTCPGTEGEFLAKYSQLQTDTSYFYIPQLSTLMNNLDDGISRGHTVGTIVGYASQDWELVIFDNSLDNHNGRINAAFLWGDILNKADADPN